ncbi:hypothetical protein [Streptomyces humi]|nr:hypothetical protein [Streptomyces humi]
MTEHPASPPSGSRRGPLVVLLFGVLPVGVTQDGRWVRRPGTPLVR